MKVVRVINSIPGYYELLKLYEEIDKKIARLKEKTTLSCILGCRKCCETSAENIQVSIFELIPLAVELWKNDSANIILEKIDDQELSKNCVLYVRDSLICKNGGCSFYKHRPLICRLFGFSAVMNKYGKRELSVCKFMGSSRNELIQEIRNKVEDSGDLPAYSEYTQRMMGINPYLGQNRYPINIAIKNAIELIGYKLMLIENLESDTQKPEYSV
ncbi:MAG: YkgJ family cysteine cluster protein [Thermotogota bacterium]|nr:YkgJ family cysteine cluster protein [Thermotogota bacterium]